MEKKNVETKSRIKFNDQQDTPGLETMVIQIHPNDGKIERLNNSVISMWEIGDTFMGAKLSYHVTLINCPFLFILLFN